MMTDAFHYALTKLRPFTSTSAKNQFLSVLDDEGVDEALSFALASGNVPTDDVRTILCYGAFDENSFTSRRLVTSVMSKANPS